MPPWCVNRRLPKVKDINLLIVFYFISLAPLCLLDHGLQGSQFFLGARLEQLPLQSPRNCCQGYSGSENLLFYFYTFKLLLFFLLPIWFYFYFYISNLSDKFPMKNEDLDRILSLCADMLLKENHFKKDLLWTGVYRKYFKEKSWKNLYLNVRLHEYLAHWYIAKWIICQIRIKTTF